MLVSGVIAAGGLQFRELLKYDRIAIDGGEFWRLLSGHFAHLNPTHLLLNLAGLVLVWLLTGRLFRTAEWLAVTAVTIFVIDLGFWFLDPNMLWYVGLSGLLHGLLIAGAIRGFASMPVEASVICVGVTLKLAWEQFAGPLPGSEQAAGAAVVVNAHLFGAIGGVASAALLWCTGRWKASI